MVTSGGSVVSSTCLAGVVDVPDGTVVGKIWLVDPMAGSAVTGTVTF